MKKIETRRFTDGAKAQAYIEAWESKGYATKIEDSMRFVNGQRVVEFTVTVIEIK